jgi:hypothetical protein
MTMRLNDAFPSKWLKADEDVPPEGDLIVTITGAEVETLGQGKDAEEKVVLKFRETGKGLVLNKTNWNTISKVLGSDDTDDWEGKRIALCSMDVQFSGEMVRAIRVRPRAPKPPAPAPAKHALSRPAEPTTPADDSNIPFTIPKDDDGEDDIDIAF